VLSFGTNNQATFPNQINITTTGSSNYAQVNLNSNNGTSNFNFGAHAITNSFFIYDVKATANRWQIDGSGNHNFYAGNITTTGTGSFGGLSSSGNVSITGTSTLTTDNGLTTHGAPGNTGQAL
jgi:hypothetical protein